MITRCKKRIIDFSTSFITKKRIINCQKLNFHMFFSYENSILHYATYIFRQTGSFQENSLSYFRVI